MHKMRAPILPFTQGKFIKKLSMNNKVSLNQEHERINTAMNFSAMKVKVVKRLFKAR